MWPSWGQVKWKKSVVLLAEEVGDSKSQIQRFIRLTELIPELLELVDEKQIALSPAVELSFLTDEQQYSVLDYIDYNAVTPSHAQTIRMKKLSQEGTLTVELIESIMSEEKSNQISKIKFNENRIRSVLPKNIEDKKLKILLWMLLSFITNTCKDKNLWMQGNGSLYSTNPSLQSTLVYITNC